MAFTREQIIEFSSSLSTTDPTKFTATDIDRIKEFIQSDGCTIVVDICVEACIEHDFYYTTKMHFTGHKITRAEADALFREAIQRYSILGNGSPLSFWRWMAVRSMGWIFWNKKGK